MVDGSEGNGQEETLVFPWSISTLVYIMLLLSMTLPPLILKMWLWSYYANHVLSLLDAGSISKPPHNNKKGMAVSLEQDWSVRVEFQNGKRQNVKNHLLSYSPTEVLDPRYRNSKEVDHKMCSETLILVSMPWEHKRKLEKAEDKFPWKMC